MMLSQSAQAQLRVSSPNDNKKESAAIPHIKKSAPNFEVRHLAPAKASSSQQSVLIDEDFSLVTNGSETAPDTTRYLASQYPQFGDGIYIDPTLTKDGTWGGDWVMAAGGMLYLRTYNPQLPATLFTPMGDYSGDITISFRVKSVPYYIPSGTDESGNQKWAYYWGSSINVFAFKGGYESTERPNTDMNTYGESYRFYPTEGWQEIEVTFRNFDADNSTYLAFTTNDAVLIDDIKVTANYDEFIAQPHVLGVTDYQKDQFTIAWEPVRHSYNYYIDLWQKTYTTDTEESFTEDFENYTGTPEGWASTTTAISDTEGQEGTKGLKMVNGDTLTLPKTQGTYKTAALYMNVVDPTVDMNDPWWQWYIKGSITVEALNENGEWITLGSMWASNAAGGGVMVLTDQQQSANKYYAYRISAADFSESEYLVVDNIDIVGNRAFIYERVMGPNSSNSGGNYTYYDYTKKLGQTTYTFTELNPETEYYYAVRSHHVSQFSESDLQHALGISAPVATLATDINDRGSFTANWEAAPKAMKYNVNLYGVKKVEADATDYTLLEEDFSAIDATVTEATDPMNPEILGNTSEAYSFDDYTVQPGWTGLGNTVAQGMLGCAQPYWYINYITSPVIDTSNGSSIYVTLKAYSYAGEQLTITIDGITYGIPFDENGVIDGTFEMPITKGTQQFRLVTYNYSPWMLDYMRVGQDVKAGSIVKTPLKTVETTELNYNFTNLSDYDYELFGYDVTASYEHEGKWATSVASDLILVDLEAGSSESGLHDVTGLTYPYNLGGKATFYGVDGRERATLERGLNIVRMADGTTRKIMVK